MADIRIGLLQESEPHKSLGFMLIEFYETMKSLETDKAKEGKQAVKIVMTMNDVNTLFTKHFNKK